MGSHSERCNTKKNELLKWLMCVKIIFQLCFYTYNEDKILTVKVKLIKTSKLGWIDHRVSGNIFPFE